MHQTLPNRLTLSSPDGVVPSRMVEIVCHHAGPSGQTLTQQTLSPSGEMNGSQIWWSISL